VLYITRFAGVAESADARDLKSREVHTSYRFDPGHRHQKIHVSGFELIHGFSNVYQQVMLRLWLQNVNWQALLFIYL